MGVAPDLVGRIVGEYEIKSLIGVGGMGAVYEGRHPMIGKRVAVKVLLPVFESRDQIERFIGEARAVNEIGHRAIVDLFAFGRLPEGSLYFVMELLSGHPLDHLIRHRGPLPIPDVLGYVEEACNALAAAHAVGIIHRDIKPSNLFLVTTPNGPPYLKLLDFGVAKLSSHDEASPRTGDGLALGTPDYMAPEQARGLPISPASDLYSLGCVLFELLTQRRVFVADNPQRVMFMHTEDAPPAPSSLRPEIPEAVDNLVLWMLEKYPDARPQSGEEVARHCASLRVQLSQRPASPAELRPIPPLRSQRVDLTPPSPPSDAGPSPTTGGAPTSPTSSAGPPKSFADTAARFAAARSQQVKFDVAQLEAGKVILIARPRRDIHEEPTGEIPVLRPAAAPVPRRPRTGHDSSEMTTSPGLPFEPDGGDER